MTAETPDLAVMFFQSPNAVTVHAAQFALVDFRQQYFGRNASNLDANGKRLAGRVDVVPVEAHPVLAGHGFATVSTLADFDLHVFQQRALLAVQFLVEVRRHGRRFPLRPLVHRHLHVQKLLKPRFSAAANTDPDAITNFSFQINHIVLFGQSQQTLFGSAVVSIGQHVVDAPRFGGSEKPALEALGLTALLIIPAMCGCEFLPEIALIAFATDVLSAPFHHVLEWHRCSALLASLVTGNQHGISSGGDRKSKSFGPVASMNHQRHIVFVGRRVLFHRNRCCIRGFRH